MILAVIGKRHFLGTVMSGAKFFGSEIALILALVTGIAVGTGLGWFTFPYMFPFFQSSGLAAWAGAGGSVAAACGAFYAARIALKMAEDNRLREEKEKLETAKQVICHKTYQYTSIVAEIDWIINSRSGIRTCPEKKKPLALEMPGAVSNFSEWMGWLEIVDMTSAYLLSFSVGRTLFSLTERVNFLSRFSGFSDKENLYLVPLKQLLDARLLAQCLSYGLNELMKGSPNWEEVINGKGFEFPPSSINPK